MTEQEVIFREFENEKGFDPITTSDCELTNWLIKKLIEARNELNTLRLDGVISAELCSHNYIPYNSWREKCKKCGDTIDRKF